MGKQMNLLRGLSFSFFLVGCAGKLPSNLGVTEGLLSPCPKAPHCVSTQSEKPGQKLEPLLFSSDLRTVHDALLREIKKMKRTRILVDQPNYIHAEIRTALLRFADDLEIFIDEDRNRVHFRSSSRYGYYDFGVNRKRVEALKASLGKL